MARELAFGGRTNEDPYKHRRSFLEICGTIKMNGVSNDAIKLKLFFTGPSKGLVGNHTTREYHYMGDLGSSFLE